MKLVFGKETKRKRNKKKRKKKEKKKKEKEKGKEKEKEKGNRKEKGKRKKEKKERIPCMHALQVLTFAVPILHPKHEQWCHHFQILFFCHLEKRKQTIPSSIRKLNYLKTNK